jgi:hypothetical protein
MGNRVSVQFVGDGQKSAVLFDHWGGTKTVKAARAFVTKVTKMADGRPLGRGEPGHVMTAFVRDYAGITDSCYLVPTKEDGDDSDNGHFIINTSQRDRR